MYNKVDMEERKATRTLCQAFFTPRSHACGGLVHLTDMDQAERFYSEQVGFVVDYDTQATDEIRNVQLTPPGSACSIALSTLNVTPTGAVEAPPGSAQGLQLVVSDVQAARAELVQRGVEVSGSTTSRMVPGLPGEAGPGTRSCSSTIPTATAGSSRSAPPTADSRTPPASSPGGSPPWSPARSSRLGAPFDRPGSAVVQLWQRVHEAASLRPVHGSSRPAASTDGVEGPW